MPAGTTDPVRPIAVIGERELVIGFRLIGVRDAVIAPERGAEAALQELVTSGKYSLILAGQKVQGALSEKFRRQLEGSLDPLVVFLPTPGAGEEPESLAALAKRILGISLEASLSPNQAR